MLECLERATGPQPAHAVIWLHGLGADAGDFWPIVPELRLPPKPAWRFVFPNAPVRNVTLNGGMPMRAWFDLDSLDPPTTADGEGMDASCAALEALVQREERRGIARRNIVLAGFSQGGAIAARTALVADRPVGGMLALSTYIPASESSRRGAGAAGLACFVAHGRCDEVLPLRLGLELRDNLKAAGCQVQWHEYEMGHQVCAEEIVGIAAFLRARADRAVAA
ncbi:MAG: carboxylesterase [Gammaproteobacteria bacterium]|nr:carboxylesterase [Gammaproteobacteria bacterium]MCY4165097.1 carboxylesterase [Gammaproteobacteria bacterium]MCY4255684.1 carboxylesterase [Gammaproteobacteria bacterium]MCY4340298.1 carboxylesterase [Gammaproteobacteria bacterium]